MLRELNLSSAAARSTMVQEQVAVALQSGDRGDAERVLRSHLLQQPLDACALTSLAQILVEDWQIEEATLLLRRAAASDPVLERRLLLVSHLLRYVGAEQALCELEQLSPGERESVGSLAVEAACRGSLGQLDEQILIFQRLSQAFPGNAELLKALGDALNATGRTDEAVQVLHRAIEAKPDYGEAWWTLSNLKSYHFSDTEISAMRKMLRRKPGDDNALQFHFALGAAFEQRAEYGASFRHYEAANAIRRKGIAPAAMRITELVDQAIETFDEALFDRQRGAGAMADDPVFVVGMHRSGTTLIEQILGSHPDVEATSELMVMQHIWQRLGRIASLSGRSAFQQLMAMDGAAFREIGEEYLQRTRTFRTTNRRFFVDKLPANWLHVGLIRLALPNAKIIEARRHPMACGFSNFKQNYASGILFAYALDSIGSFTRDYIRFMDHMARVQPLSIHRVINERLIEEPEREIRRMLEFIGVPFDPSCLAFHRTERAIRTPSAAQVRRPLNRDGIDQWRNYEQWLEPLKEALGPALESWDRATPQH